MVCQILEMNAVTTRQNLECPVSGAEALTVDIYYPPDAKKEERIPAVVFVLGYSDTGFQKMLGCKQKEMESYICWARLVAASGLIAITYTTKAPMTDIHSLFQHLWQHSVELGIDESRIGVWASSGNAPNALSVLMQQTGGIKCAAFCYGYLLDLSDNTAVADAARQWGFVNPNGAKTIADLPPDIPLFVVRAGGDETPGLNETIDRFLAEALGSNLPITVTNLPAAPHAFDLMYDSPASREAIRQILGFLQSHLFEQS